MALFDDASLVVTPNGYKAGTLYSIKPTSGAGDMTVVRATTATRVNSAGLIESVANNVPRLDYLNASCPSLLLEPQRTNLQVYSEDFSNPAWTGSRITITNNDTISPNGELTAEKATGDGTGSSYVFDGHTLTNGATYTISIFVKKIINISSFVINIFGGVGAANFNLVDKTVNSISGDFTSAKIEDYGNGWLRCSGTLTLSSSTGNKNIGYGLFNYNGDQYYIWGAQLEVGNYPTSYIPTTSAAVTRNADKISKTGISSLINSTEGVLFIETKGFVDTQPNSTYIQLSKNGESGFNNSLVLAHRNNGFFRVYANGSITPDIQFNVNIDFTENHKIAVLYKLNGYKLFIDGVAQNLYLTPTQVVFSGLDNLSFDLRGSQSWNAKIKNFILFPSALSDTELTELTTL
jgi:hypothetical protein